MGRSSRDRYSKKPIRLTVLLSVGVALLLFTLAFSFFLRTNMLHLLSHSEEDRIISQSELMGAIITNSVLDLKRITRQWACFDDTYNLAIEKSPSNISQYFNKDPFVYQNKLSVVMLNDLSGNNLYTDIRDDNANKSIDNSIGFSRAIALFSKKVIAEYSPKNNTLYSDIGYEGFFIYNEKAYYLAILPILTTDELSSPAGTIIFGRELDSFLLSEMAKTERLKFSITNLGDVKTMEQAGGSIKVINTTNNSATKLYQQSPQALLAILSSGQSILETNKNSLCLYIPLYSLNNQYDMMITIKEERSLYTIGNGIINSSQLTLLVLVFLFIAWLYYLLESHLLSPIVHLSGEVQRVAEISSSSNVSVCGNGKEFHKLSVSINDMLARLRESAKVAEQSKISLNELNNILNGVEASIYLANPVSGEILFMNDFMRQYIKKELDIEDAKSSTLTSYVINQGNESLNDATPDHATICYKQSSVSKNYYLFTNRLIPWVENDKAFLYTILDITETKKTERELLRLSSIVNSSPEFVCCVDKDMKFDYINPAVFDIFGFTAQELLGKNISVLLSQDTTQYLKKTVVPMVLEHNKFNYEIPALCKDGSEKIMSISSFQVGSEFIEFGSIASDVTKKRELEGQLIQATETAIYANQAKSDFLSRMSHEIRTPMSAIIGMTNIAINSNDSSKKDYCLEKIDTASKHLLGVINDILDMSKIEANKFELSNHSFSIEQMLAKVSALLTTRAEEKNISMTMTLQDDLPQYLVGDEQRLAQVLTNLVSNSLKFTPDNGSVVITIKKITEQADSILLKVEVKDNGIGISQEQKKLLFQSFQQADGSISRRFGGSGLGLSISKYIVELMDGEIWFESEVSKGSTFIFTCKLGISDNNKSAFEKNLLFQNYSFSNHAILLAEDFPINREIVSSILEQTGIKIHYASNGLEAVNLFKANKNLYSLIFMDIQMPEMDGFEATRTIRKLDYQEAKTIPIIAMTANVFKEDIARCKEAGMDEHIGKPINPDELFNKMIRFLPAIPPSNNLKSDKAFENNTPNTLSTRPGFDSSSPVIDIKDGLKRVMDDKDFYIKLLSNTGIDALAKELIDNIKHGDFQKIQDNAHTIKGASSNLGFTKLKELAEEINAKAKRQEVSFDYANLIQAAVEELNAAIEHFIKHSNIPPS